MGKPEVKILIVGDVGSAKSKFIYKFFQHYPESHRSQEETHEMYTCKGSNYVIHLYNINDAENYPFGDKVDVLLLSHTSDNPETFRSVKEIWIPRLINVDVEHPFVMDNVSSQQSSPTKEQSTVSNEQVTQFANLFGLLWCTAYSSGYKEVLATIKAILEEMSTQNQNGLNECIPYNQHSSNKSSAVEMRPTKCSTGELNQNKCSTLSLSSNAYPAIEITLMDYLVIEFIPSGHSIDLDRKRSDTEEPNTMRSDVEANPRKSDVKEAYPKKSDVEEANPKKSYVEVLSSDCSTVETYPKDYSTDEFSPSKCSTAETNSDKSFPFVSSPGYRSPGGFSTDECTPNGSPVSEDSFPSNISTPDAAFSTDELSPDECTPRGFTDSQDRWPSDKSRPDAALSIKKFSSDEWSPYGSPGSQDTLSLVISSPNAGFSTRNCVQKKVFERS